MLPLNATSYYYLTMLPPNALSQCYHTMLPLNATSHCYPTMLPHNATSQCYLTMLHHNATSQCYLTMLPLNPSPLNPFFFIFFSFSSPAVVILFHNFFFRAGWCNANALAFYLNFSSRSTIYTCFAGSNKFPVLVLACWISLNLCCHIFCSILLIIFWSISTLFLKNSKDTRLFNFDLCLET